MTFDDSTEDRESLERRLARVEETLAMLSAELMALRAQATPMAAAPQPTPVATPRVRPARKSMRVHSTDLEALLGRYGMLAIAVVAAVAAVGTFLSWAISHGYLRLTAGERVLLGLLFAAGVGTYGFRLRRRERSFGSSMLGLALVIVLVCAYAAGPGLHIVPSSMAFAGAALVSWALAFFAHSDDDEPLWCVAFGGASIAPFVTSDGRGSEYALLAYGALILLPACFAMSRRDWPIAWRVFYAASALFTLAGAGMTPDERLAAFAVSFAFPFVIAAAGVVPFAPETRKRAALRWLAVLAFLASLHSIGVWDTDQWAVSSTVLAGLAVWLLLLDRQADVAQSSITKRLRYAPLALDVIDAAVLPLLFATLAAIALGFTHHVWPVFATCAILSAAFVWRRVAGFLRDAGALACAASAIIVVETLPLEWPLRRVAVAVALALLLLAAHVVRPSRTWVFVGGGYLAAVALRVVVALVERPRYQFSPFGTEASAAALAVLIGFIVVARFWPSIRTATRTSLAGKPEWVYAGELRVLLRAAAGARWAWAFVWILIELSMAYSASTSTLLLVIYFAATAVASVAIGRARHRAWLRRVGLGLALAAAATAWYGASTYFDFGARIAAYLVTSAFLLGIAYWYRKPGAVAEQTAR